MATVTTAVDIDLIVEAEGLRYGSSWLLVLVSAHQSMGEVASHFLSQALEGDVGEHHGPAGDVFCPLVFTDAHDGLIISSWFGKVWLAGVHPSCPFAVFITCCC